MDTAKGGMVKKIKEKNKLCENNKKNLSNLETRVKVFDI
jgi:hypothetical protein